MMITTITITHGNQPPAHDDGCNKPIKERRKLCKEEAIHLISIVD
jgi:hypothetical protein